MSIWLHNLAIFIFQKWKDVRVIQCFRRFVAVNVPADGPRPLEARDEGTSQ